MAGAEVAQAGRVAVSRRTPRPLRVQGLRLGMTDRRRSRWPGASLGRTMRVACLLGLVAVAALGAQGGITVENGIRFPDGTIQSTSAQPVPVVVRESGLRRCFDASGTEIACAGTDHDGDGRPGMEWSAAGRFLDVNANGTVIDSLTGLLWLKDAGCISSAGWDDALASVDLLNTGTDFGCTEYTPGTFDDWRMPSITELASLIDYGSSDALPAGHPFVDPGIGNCWTWSSTTLLNDTTRAWGVPLANPGHPSPHQIQGLIKNNPNNCLWPVRNQNVPVVPIDIALAVAEGGVTFADGSRQESAPLSGLLRLRQTGQTTCFNDLGIEIVCTGSGQDGELQTGVPWPQPRFADNGDGTVEDRLTGLTWLKHLQCLGENVNWQDAVGAVGDLSDGTDFGCTDYTPGSFDDWRLPAITEMVSLFDFGSSDGLPAGHPFDFSGGGFCLSFWSSTSDVAFPDEAWRLNVGPDASFFDVQSAQKSSTLCVWPVREG